MRKKCQGGPVLMWEKYISVSKFDYYPECWMRSFWSTGLATHRIQADLNLSISNRSLQFEFKWHIPCANHTIFIN